MNQFLEAFALGNAAILGNVCMLPLYPGLVAMLAASADGGRPARWTSLLGVVVFAGVLACMLAIGFSLYLVGRSAADILGWLLPAMYLMVLALGIAMVLGRNPFTRLSAGEVPLLRNRGATAFVYGLFLAPMTLPCTGPLIVSAFVVGGVAGSAALGESLRYFAWYALGFGWPLIVLPLVATPLQRQFTGVLTRQHQRIAIASGLLLIGIAVFGLWVDVRPTLT